MRNKTAYDSGRADSRGPGTTYRIRQAAATPQRSALGSLVRATAPTLQVGCLDRQQQRFSSGSRLTNITASREHCKHLIYLSPARQERSRTWRTKSGECRNSGRGATLRSLVRGTAEKGDHAFDASRSCDERRVAGCAHTTSLSHCVAIPKSKNSDNVQRESERASDCHKCCRLEAHVLSGQVHACVKAAAA